jgi:hypothetical protein
MVITNNQNSLTITVSNVSSWSFGVIHIYIGNGPIPSTPTGTPIPGQFPFKISFASNVQTWSNTWSLEQLNATFGGFVPSCGASFYILTHFELHGPSDETGWGFGSIPFSTFGSPRWGWAMNYTWCCSQPPQPENEGCTYTQGYWKNHNDFSTRPSQHIAWPIDENTEKCGQTWLSILQTPVKGNKWLILAHQWVAAKLNVANGADATAVAATLIEAETILNTCTLSDQDARRATQLASILDQYNNGIIGPGHCDDVAISTDICACRCPVQEDAEEKHKAKLPRFHVDSNEPRQTLTVVNQKKTNALLNKATKVHFEVDVEEGSSCQLTVVNGNNKAKFESSGNHPSVEVDSDSADSFIVSVSSPDGSSIMGSVSVSYDVPADSTTGSNSGSNAGPASSGNGNGGVSSSASTAVASVVLMVVSAALAMF